MGRYWVNRRGEWIESLMVIADGPDEALKLAETIPDEAWKATHEDYERRGKNKFSLNGVSISDERTAWNEDTNAVPPITDRDDDLTPLADG